MQPLISILLAVRDAGDVFEPCLRSIARQREERFECWIVDDGSRDDSAAIARTWASRDPRFRVMRREHEGLVASLNAGLEACRAPFIARMDADDWMHRDRLALQLRALETQPEWSALGCHVRIFPRGAGSRRRDARDLGPVPRRGRSAYEAWLNAIESPADVAREAFIECPVAHPTLFARGEVLRGFGYRDEGWPEDYDLILRLLARGHAIGVQPRRLVGWRDSQGRLSRTDARYAIARFVACKAAHLADSFLAHSDEYVLWGYGETGRNLRKALLAHGRTPSQIVEMHPRRIGQRIHGAPVISPEQLAAMRERAPLLVSVAGPDPRALIRAALQGMGLVEGSDFVCVA